MELHDTVPLMLSEDYEDRLKARCEISGIELKEV